MKVLDNFSFTDAVIKNLQFILESKSVRPTCLTLNCIGNLDISGVAVGTSYRVSAGNPVGNRIGEVDGVSLYCDTEFAKDQKFVISLLRVKFDEEYLVGNLPKGIEMEVIKISPLHKMGKTKASPPKS